jgi:hypothetical protein
VKEEPSVVRLGEERVTEMSAEAPTSVLRELDSRAGDGVHISLLWNERTATVSVSVSDPRSGEEFELVVGPDESALDVFNHPYAYAAARGVDHA